MENSKTVNPKSEGGHLPGSQDRDFFLFWIGVCLQEVVTCGGSTVSIIYSSILIIHSFCGLNIVKDVLVAPG